MTLAFLSGHDRGMAEAGRRPAWTSPARIGAYRRIAELGERVHAHVVAVVADDDPEVRVATILRQELAFRADVVGEFVRVGRALQRIGHESLGRIHDVGILAQGQPYLVMDHVRGQSVADLAAHPVRRQCELVIDVGMAIASALAAAHGAGLLHLDLAAANILVARDGTSTSGSRRNPAAFVSRRRRERAGWRALSGGPGRLLHSATVTQKATCQVGRPRTMAYVPRPTPPGSTGTVIAHRGKLVSRISEDDYHAAIESVARLADFESIVALIDLDGTLAPLAQPLGDDWLDRGARVLLRDLDESGAKVVVISRRSRDSIEPLRRLVPSVWWMAEHGAWRATDRGWCGPESSAPCLESLALAWSRIAARSAGAWIEPKSLSISFHWSGVATRERDALVSQVEAVSDEWLDGEPDFERLSGRFGVEVRRRGVQTGLAVDWIRGESPDARIIAVGDDLADEDMFAALHPGDVAVLASLSLGRSSRATVWVDGPAEVRQLLRWLAERRAVGRPLPHGLLKRRRGLVRAPTRQNELLVVSNRTAAPVGDDRVREVGGLVSALEPALRERNGIWLGWSGREREGEPALVVDEDSHPSRASFDYPPLWRRRFYSGFCNGALWPLMHGLVDRARYEDADWEAYVAANATYARLARELVPVDATVWVHDYHLLLMGKVLREAGHRGPIGIFVHVPFPARVELETFPWAHELVEALSHFDLIGFHCQRWVENLRESAASLHDRVDVFPLGVDERAFSVGARAARGPIAPDIAGLQLDCRQRRLLLGVDRLDYSKGIPERLLAYERLLERFTEWRRKVSFLQISVPSRADVPEYAELRRVVENLVGRINGRFGETDWVPVRYLCRSYTHEMLADLYRAAAVAVVTPLRDGMNLVAKEFVAAQDAEDPGVLVLSRFAGAASVLEDAILTNPFHTDGLAADLDRALRMSLQERYARHRCLLRSMEATSPPQWASKFLSRLHRSSTRAGD